MKPFGATGKGVVSLGQETRAVRMGRGGFIPSPNPRLLAHPALGMLASPLLHPPWPCAHHLSLRGQLLQGLASETASASLPDPRLSQAPLRQACKALLCGILHTWTSYYYF